MRTTIELPGELLRQAKVQAAMEGRPLKELIAEALDRFLKAPAIRTKKPHFTKFPIIKPTGQIITSEMVAKAEDEFLEEEAARHARIAGR